MNTAGRGLTSSEAERLTQEGKSNVQVHESSKTVGQILRENIFTYFNFLFLVLGAMLFVVGAYRDMTFLIIIVANTLIGIGQELYSKSVLDKLSVLNAPKTEVYRDGVLTEIPTEELVLGDLVHYRSGKQIGADATVQEGSVRVNEALVTGEADEIVKGPGDRLLSGSFIVSGSCDATLTAVGQDSYVSHLTAEAKKAEGQQQTEMMRSLSRLLHVIGIIIVPLGIGMMVQDIMFLGMTVYQSVVAMVAAVIGMIPEGLYLLTSVRLAMAVALLAHQRVIVHRMASVETLARVDTLCVDKTGTITENEMKVHGVKIVEGAEKAEVLAHLADLTEAMSSDNLTMATLKSYIEHKQEKAAAAAQPPRKVYPFTSELKFSGVSFETADYLIGAPERLLLSEYDRYRNVIEEGAEQGYRVLAFGRLPDGQRINGKPLTVPVIPEAFIFLGNAIREQAPETFRYFQEQGVTVKVISGDNPVTVSAVAKMAGIKDADRYIDAGELKTWGDYRAGVSRYTVFGRVQPEQKKKLIAALKADKRVVAMTGDGVNDVLALKEADCSVAMASGSEAAANCAQIVLLDSDFSCMPEVVLQGRQVVNNIQRSASLFLVKNIFSILMCVLTLAFALTYPLRAAQISLISAFTIGMPAFLLAMQPENKLIRGKFLSTAILNALPGGLTDFTAVACMTLFGAAAKIPLESQSVMTVIVMLFVGVCVLIRVCRPFDIFRVIVIVLSVAAAIGAIILFPSVFSMTMISTREILLLFPTCAASGALFFGLSVLIDRIRRYFGEREYRMSKWYRKLHRRSGW
ncbi:MAG: HAD-IC family P-type ATPase [Lachnospiraceae bacterium]|nr:HAD-IC family P-type ATPase [Lachnospiraceae bacterium]